MIIPGLVSEMPFVVALIRLAATSFTAVTGEDSSTVMMLDDVDDAQVIERLLRKKTVQRNDLIELTGDN